MKAVRLLALAACPATLAFAGYTYDYAGLLNPYSASQWTANGSYSASTGMFTSSASNGGSLILNGSVPSTPNNYEVRTTLTLTQSGGTYISYLRATSNALAASGNTGTWYAVEIANPTFSGSSCSATLSILESSSGTVTSLYSGTVPCHNGMAVRSIETEYSSGFIVVYIDNAPWGQAYGTGIASGQPGIGVIAAPSGNGISTVDIGHVDTVGPSAFNTQTIGTSVFPNRVDIQWQGVLDDPNGPGIAYYQVARNGQYIGAVFGSVTEFSDETVSPGANYAYTIGAVDYDLNVSGASITVTTPPSGSIDPRQVGVRSTGTYWGGGGEQIDMRSGNLNYTVPLIKALGRGGWSIGFNLNYNSQNWRQDPGGTWQLGRDVGYGYGWKLLAGSLTPYYSYFWTIDHFLFIDSTGAEYRLTQNNSGVWSSTDGIHIWFDTSANRLHFPDGSFWVMGTISAGTEQDSGTMYPTIIEDSNGNQVNITYDDGVGVTWANSSARITSVADFRGGFSFIYNRTSGPIPYLSSIGDSTGSGENYSFSIATNQQLTSPFSSTSYGATWGYLSSLSQTGTGLTTSFTYDSAHSGELDQVTTPYGGHLRWQYTGIMLGGTRTLREVQNRYLALSSGVTERQYTMTRLSDTNQTVHSSAQWDDVTGNAEKFWQFQTASQFNVGMATSYEERQLPSQTALTHTDYTWSQDPGGNPYISAAATTLDPTQSYAIQKKTTQTMDQYGNVTQTQVYDFGNLTTPARTTTNTYTMYSSQYLFNRLQTSTVANNGSTQTATPVSNSYDQATLSNNSNLPNHDAAYSTSFTARGNVTTSVTLSGTTTATYDIGGNALTTTTNGVTTTSTVTSSSYYTAPSAITTNSLTTSLNWTGFLGLSSTTGPNGDSASIGYNSNARPISTTSPNGAVTNYAYYDTASPPYTTATINGRVTTTTMDGFGRAIKIVRSTGSTTISTVDVVYDACGCSPLGKLKQQSQPYAPGQTEYWTTYTYDALGRTATVTAPDSSLTSYSYAGNTVTVTDPAGKWKKFTMDAFGNLTQVVEPDPTLGNVTSSYTYDVLNHLTQVSMPRGSTTQTRTFNYASGSAVGGYLLSATNPENGTVTYTYNSNGTLATKTDAKNQQIQYSYDTYHRVTQVRHYPVTGQAEDTSQQVNYYYDTNPFDGGTFTQYAQGRLAAVTYNTLYNSLLSTQGPQIAEWYSYTQPGQANKKRLQLTESGHTLNMDASYTYDNEGRTTSVAYPNFNAATYGTPAPTYNYTFDAMGRLSGMTDQSNNTEVYNVSYGPSSEILGISYFGAWESRTYNSRLQLTSLSVTGAGSVSLNYTYPTNGTNNGKISSQTDNVSVETVQYTYDSLNRLIQAQATSGSWGQGFTYDPFGNLTAKTVTAGSAPSLSVSVDPTTNRVSGFSNIYDANGNQTGYNGNSYGYDVENRMEAYGNPLLLYAYSPQNKRVWKGTYDQNWDLTAQEVYFYGVDGKKLGTYSVSFQGTPGASSTDLLVYFGRRQVGKMNLGAIGAFVANRLGSLASAASFYPYGEDKGTPAPNDQVKFATYTRDSGTLLDYADQRYYNNSLGRFMSPDRYIASSGQGDPQSWNRYPYVENDPVNVFDPSGRYGCNPDDLTCVPDPGGPPPTYCEGSEDCPPEDPGTPPPPPPCPITAGIGGSLWDYIRTAPAYYVNGGPPGTPIGAWGRPLEWWTPTILADSVKYNVDPRLIVAIAQIETHFGADYCGGVKNKNKNNPFCIGDLNPKLFTDIGQAIDFIARFLASRIDPTTTVADLYAPITGRYCNTAECNPTGVHNALSAQGGGNGVPGVYGPLQSPCYLGSDGKYYLKQ